MEDVLQKQIENQYTLNSLGVLYKDDGFLAEAKTCFENAIKIDGNYRPALYNLSLINLLEGNLKDGLAGFNYRNKTNNLSTRGKLPPLKKLNNESDHSSLSFKNFD